MKTAVKFIRNWLALLQLNGAWQCSLESGKPHGKRMNGRNNEDKYFVSVYVLLVVNGEKNAASTHLFPPCYRSASVMQC